MSNQTIHKFWNNFLEIGEVSKSAVPKSILESSQFEAFYSGLQDAAIISEKRGKGSVLKLNETKRHLIETYFKKTFPNSIKSVLTKNDSVAMFRDSKTAGIKEKAIFFLKGKHIIRLNEVDFDLKSVSEEYGLSAHFVPSIEFENICIVENKDTFIDAHKLLGDKYIYVHKYGRFGKEDVNLFKASKIVVFSDYDYIGLNEYLTFKSKHSNTSLFYPNNFDELFDKYSSTLPEKQIPSKQVQESTDPVVVKIRTQLQKENKFLEQQALFIENIA
jgi:hypothetical protein